jgi:7-cyano-7-deazaguanine reductase
MTTAPRVLGKPSRVPASPDQATLDRVPNPHPDTDYVARFTMPEFTVMCPVTGQPDFATITIAYVPDELCVEMKSLKLYFLSFRNKGIFYEAVTNQILDDLVEVIQPRRMTVVGDFAVRGGTAGTVTASHVAPAKKGRNGRKSR